MYRRRQTREGSADKALERASEKETQPRKKLTSAVLTWIRERHKNCLRPRVCAYDCVYACSWHGPLVADPSQPASQARERESARVRKRESVCRVLQPSCPLSPSSSHLRQ